MFLGRTPRLTGLAAWAARRQSHRGIALRVSQGLPPVPAHRVPIAPKWKWTTRHARDRLMIERSKSQQQHADCTSIWVAGAWPVYRSRSGELPHPDFLPALGGRFLQMGFQPHRPERRPLLLREHRRQIPEFGLHFRGIGHRIRDFLAKEVAIPLAEPVNGHLERPL
jgi:hypothetical protein